LKKFTFSTFFGSKTDLSKLDKILELKHGLPPFCAKIWNKLLQKPSKTTGQQNSANLTGTAKITFTY
jgi:hypothetical protein